MFTLGKINDTLDKKTKPIPQNSLETVNVKAPSRLTRSSIVITKVNEQIEIDDTPEIASMVELVSQDIKVLSAGAYSLLRLMESLPRYKNFKVYFDNWFSSPFLLEKLLSFGFHSVSTVRVNRIPDITFPMTDKIFKKSVRGTYESMINQNGNIALLGGMTINLLLLYHLMLALNLSKLLHDGMERQKKE